MSDRGEQCVSDGGVQPEEANVHDREQQREDERAGVAVGAPSGDQGRERHFPAHLGEQTGGNEPE